MHQDTLIAVGRLTKPHGLQGEIVFLPYVSDLTLLPDFVNQQVCLQSRTAHMQERTIVAARMFHKKMLLRLNDCQGIADAEALRDSEVLIPQSRFALLPEGEYYWFEIEGLTVYTDSGRCLGSIADIIHTGSNDVYVVREDKHERLVPALKDIVRTIDIDRGEMHLFPVQEPFD